VTQTRGTPAHTDFAQRLSHLEADTGLRFHDRGLLAEALTHRSYVNEHPECDLADNQRLEFLGDAVLDLIVGEWLYRRFPNMKEGDLTNLRAHVVCTETLAKFAGEIALGSYLRLGKGEAATGGSERPANLCAAFEALVGACYLDRGLDATGSWVKSFLEKHIGEIRRDSFVRDAKSRLQELVQATLRTTPAYRIVGESGPEHAKIFVAEVHVDDQQWGRGEGTTKQAAEQAAAEAALDAHRELAENGTHTNTH